MERKKKRREKCQGCRKGVDRKKYE